MKHYNANILKSDDIMLIYYYYYYYYYYFADRWTRLAGCYGVHSWWGLFRRLGIKTWSGVPYGPERCLCQFQLQTWSAW